MDRELACTLIAFGIVFISVSVGLKYEWWQGTLLLGFGFGIFGLIGWMMGDE